MSDRLPAVPDRSVELLSGAESPLERQLALLVWLSLQLADESDLDRMTALTAACLQEALGCDFTKVLDARTSATGLLVRGGAGWPRGVVGEREVPEGAASQGGYTLEIGEPVIVEDLLTETRFKAPPLLLEHGVRSGVSVIIEGAPEPFGVLQADSREPGSFDLPDIAVVAAFAAIQAKAAARLEAQLAREHFASIAAHELRTPLTLITGHATRLLNRIQRGESIDDTDREEVVSLHDGAQRLQHAVELFLALGDVDRATLPLERTSVDLVEVVDEVIPLVKERHPESRIRIEPGADPREVVTDAGVVSRILTALVDNAVKYTGRDQPVSVVVVSDESEVGVRVIDHCGGLESHDLRHLFQQSFRGEHGQESEGGLGLGLYIAQRFTEHLGGRLAAANTGDGCVFSLYLPLEAPATR